MKRVWYNQDILNLAQQWLSSNSDISIDVLSNPDLRTRLIFPSLHVPVAPSSLSAEIINMFLSGWFAPMSIVPIDSNDVPTRDTHVAAIDYIGNTFKRAIQYNY